MKKLIALLLLMSAFATHAAELQLQECRLGTSTMEFSPSQTLTSILKRKLKGAVVYKVKYKIGQISAGPKEDLAYVKETQEKTLEVRFFELDENDSIIDKNYNVTIDLTEPVKAKSPIIIFSSVLHDPSPFIGRCDLMF